MNTPNVIDRAIEYLAPAWALRRQRARAQGLVLRHYEGASSGRRTSGWARPATDANAAQEGQLDRLRYVARDLVRNNPYADSALDIIADHVVGWGIVAKPNPTNAAAAKAWDEWAGSTACDADGRLNLYGLQKLIVRSVVRDGEVLVRRRIRRLEDEMALPIQLQVLEADFLDSFKTNMVLPNGHRIIGGVEFDAIGKRVGYWLYPEHPGSSMPGNTQTSRFVPAESVLHVFRADRPGQVRGASWFAPVVLAMKDFDDYTDAQLMKQKVAALLAGVVTDASGGNGTIVGNMVSASDEFPTLYPGGLVQAPPGTDVKFTDPPSISDYKDFSHVTLRGIAAGLGVTYEDISGDFSQVNFSSARMSRLAHYDKVHDWRWMMTIPQFCDPAWDWVMQAAIVMNRLRGPAPKALWTAPPIPMIEPDKEGLAYQRNVRAGIMTLSEAIRERGYDPKEHLAEMAQDNARLDELGLVLDSDPRKMTQAGQAQPPPPSEEPAESDPPEDDRDEPEPTPDAPEEERATPVADGLTSRQREVLRAIHAQHAAAGEPPTVSLLARSLGMDRKTLRGHLQALCDKGKLRSPSPGGIGVGV